MGAAARQLIFGESMFLQTMSCDSTARLKKAVDVVRGFPTTRILRERCEENPLRDGFKTKRVWLGEGSSGMKT